MIKCWQIDDGEMHWYAADTSYEALELHKEEFDIDDDFIEDAETDISEFPLDSELTVQYDYDDVVTKTAEEWIEELGKGLICSTAYGYL